jgi:hypothetical protein
MFTKFVHPSATGPESSLGWLLIVIRKHRPWIRYSLVQVGSNIQRISTLTHEYCWAATDYWTTVCSWTTQAWGCAYWLQWGELYIPAAFSIVNNAMACCCSYRCVYQICVHVDALSSLKLNFAVCHAILIWFLDRAGVLVSQDLVSNVLIILSDCAQLWLQICGPLHPVSSIHLHCANKCAWVAVQSSRRILALNDQTLAVSQTMCVSGFVHTYLTCLSTLKVVRRCLGFS